MRRVILQSLAVLFAAAAAYVSYDLFVFHLTGTHPSEFLKQGCSAESAASAFDCAKVAQSRWSVLPFRKESDPPDKRGIPVAALGWMYYTLMTLWLIGVGAPSRTRRWLHLLPLGLNCIALCASAFFVFIMATDRQWCSLCLATHVLNVAMFVTLVLLWPRRPAMSVGTDAPTPSASIATSLPARIEAQFEAVHDRIAPHPSLRVVMLTLGAMAIVYLFQSGLLINPGTRIQFANLVKERDGYRKVAEDYRNDARALFDAWFRREGKQIDIRPDDPIKVKPNVKALPLVIFSDFECPQCAKAAQSLAKYAEPLFDGRLKLIYKHYPLCTKCNQVAVNTHPHACDAAYAAEAARMQNKFWEAHDWMFTHQTKLANLDSEEGMRQFAKQFGLDEATFIGDMSSEAVIQRVFQDGEQGRKLGIKSTPAVYMEGKLLDNFFETNNPRFWKEVARAYWQEIIKQAPPPDVKKLLDAPDAAATPDSPGPSAAP